MKFLLNKIQILLPLFLLACSPFEKEGTKQMGDWPVASATKTNTKYSPLDQINKTNVDQLEVAWEYHTQDTGYTIECNPIIIDTVLYATTPTIKAFAVDAATGQEIWTFDPYAYEKDPELMSGSWAVNRGVTYWEDGDDRCIFLGAGPYMYALDAETGKPINNFGRKGRINLLKGLDRDIEDGRITASSPGIIYENLLIVGARVGEGSGEVVPGHVRGYDVRTGEQQWIFHTIPHPGEFGYKTWPEEAWKTFGGANPWGGFSLDEKRGIVYMGTGSPSHDHFGINRHGKNLFANSVLALDAETGKRVWHYQLVHHDLWDYDLPASPNLLTVEHEGRQIDAVAQITKMGFVYLFNRETREPLFPIEERPVPQTEIPGEETWPTQPFPTRPGPYARQGFQESDITNRTREAHDFVRKNVFEPYGEAALFQPPSFKGDVIHPQFNGGTDWGGAAVDPETGFLYVNTSNVPEFMKVVETGPEEYFPYTVTGHQPLKDNEGFPINTPPWGTLSAIDLNKGTIVWQVPFGTYPELEGNYTPPTGTFNMGGPVVTAGGLLFLGGSMDEKFRAFDKETGEILWETNLPAGGYATPSVYAVDGRQYVVIGAGGGGKPGTSPGDSYVAFALPDSATSQEHTEAVTEESEEPVVTEGAQIYTSRCASCHQFNGSGAGGDFPPLTGTQWVTGTKGRLIRIVLDGLSGPIEVNGNQYDGAMPGWKRFLDDEQVASLLTYIRSSWGNDASAVNAEEVARVREATHSRNSMWTGKELKMIESEGTYGN